MQEIKTKIHKWNYEELKSFYITKKQKSKKIFVNYASDKELLNIPQIHWQKNQKNAIRFGNPCPSKKTYKWPNSI